MDKKSKNKVIGYSVFILFEECYEYVENACFLAGSYGSAAINCRYDKSNIRVDEISIDMLINDYGCSSGEYTMEQLAFEKFRKVADEKGLKYTFKDFYMDENLKVVNL